MLRDNLRYSALFSVDADTIYLHRRDSTREQVGLHYSFCSLKSDVQSLTDAQGK